MKPADRPTPILFRLCFAVPLILLAAFSCFGFLATFELSEWSARLPWLVGYSLLGLACLGGVLALLRPQRQTPTAERQLPGR